MRFRVWNIIVCAALFVLHGSFVFAQEPSIYVSGRILNFETAEGIAGVVIEVKSAANAQKVRHYTTEYGGYFRIPGLKSGTYYCKATFMGMEDYEFSFKVTYVPKDLGDLHMKTKAIGIEAIGVTAVSQRATIMGDTLSFNADAFKVAADAEVETLLKKMPGITIQDGRIEAQGEEVKQIYVDGSEFFGGNIQQALQSIPAQAVERIEVYNRLSEAAQITGVDDGEGGKVINIVTKGSLKRSQFGKMHLGLGMEPNSNHAVTRDFKYTGGGSVNIFHDDARITAMVLVNNINKQNFSADEMSMGNANSSNSTSRQFSINSQNGVASAEMAAVNYSDRWGRRRRAKFEGNLFYHHMNAKNEFSIDRWYNAPAKIDTAHYDQFADPNTHTLRFRGRMDWKIAKRQKLVLIPNVSYTNSKSLNFVDTTSTRWGESGLRYIPSGNDGWSHSYSANIYAQYSYHFFRQGRTLMVVVSGGKSNTDMDRNYYSYSGKVWPVDFEKKFSFSRKFTHTNNGTIRIQPTFRERLGRHTHLNMMYRFQYQPRDREILNYKTKSDYVIDESKLKKQTSSFFESDFIYHQAGLGFRYGRNRNWFSVAANLQNTRIRTKNIWEGTTSLRSYLHPAYNATLQWAFSQKNSIRLSCNSDIRAPGTWQMLDIFDVSNSNYVSRGNPDLKPVCEYNFFGRYTNVSPTKGTTFMLLAKAEHRQDYIGSKIAYSPNSFEYEETKYSPIQISKPVNLSGFWSYEARTSFGFPLKFIKSNLNMGIGAVYSTVPIEIVKGEDVDIATDEHFDVKGDVDMMKNTAINSNLTLGSNISEKVDFTITWRSTYSTNGSQLAILNNRYFTHTAALNFKSVLPAGFTVTTRASFTQFVGFTNNFNDNFALWDVAVGKKVLNSLGEIQLCVYDVLDQNKSFGRAVWSGYSQIRYNSVMGRYFMIRFTYNLRHISGGLSALKGKTSRSAAPVNRFDQIEQRLNQILKF